jgi:hypothetical protein
MTNAGVGISGRDSFDGLGGNRGRALVSKEELVKMRIAAVDGTRQFCSNLNFFLFAPLCILVKQKFSKQNKEKGSKAEERNKAFEITTQTLIAPSGRVK